MMRTTVSTQPQIIIVACCITLRRNGYDTAGNIRSITKDGTVTKSFGYTNPSWPDLLTSVTANGTTKDVLYEGQSQTSDLPSSGNPITYYNGKDYTFTWTKGRQLASATVDGKQVSYTYDMSGVRTSKTVNGTTYNYTTLSGKVMRQTWGSKSLDLDALLLRPQCAGRRHCPSEFRRRARRVLQLRRVGQLLRAWC